MAPKGDSYDIQASKTRVGVVKRFGFAAATALVLAVVAIGSAASRDSAGGTLRINISNSDVTSLDPAIDYEFYGGQVMYLTCAKLLNYPDKPAPLGSQLVPEIAAGMPRVSADGRTYTFTIRPGYRFSTGEAVTAASFERVFERDLSPKMSSPAVNFLGDVVGAAAVVAGHAVKPSGVRAQGNRLTIRLTRAAPDLLARLGMPFFCAVPVSTAIDPNGLIPAGAGPYYVAKRVPNRSIVLKRNPYYTGPRPHRPTEIDISVSTNQDASYLQVTRGDVDYDFAGPPPADLGVLAHKFGTNRGRFFVHPFMSVEYLALNTQRAPLTDPHIRQAINYAVSRTAILTQNGFRAGTPTDQILPPTLHGFRDAHIYPLTQPEIDKAKALLGGQTLRINLYTTIDQANVKMATVIQANLAKIGITVDIKQYAFGVLVSKIGVPTEPYDMVLIGWFADYADPYDFVNILLEGDKITKANNVNLARFNDPKFNKEIKQAALIAGPRRYSTYGKLDVDISRVAAPWASLYNSNAREYVSAHVGCYVYQPVYAAMDLASVCLK